MKEIPLTQGKVAIVDDRDYPKLARHKWSALLVGKNWYAVNGGGKTFKYMHRLILKTLPGYQIDHRNHNGLDNRRSNLRLCNRSQNSFNRAPGRHSTSRYKGVYWRKTRSKWQVSISVNSCLRYLGIFRHEVIAAKRYDETAKAVAGEFAWLNFPYRLRRRNIYRWLRATAGRVFSVTFIKRLTGEERTLVARVGVCRNQKGGSLPFNPRKKKLIVVFDMNDRIYKCIPIDGIEAVTYRARRYRVD